MNRLKISLITIVIVLGICPAMAQQVNPITQAMLDGYANLLKQNPRDHLTLYERASQYYRLDRYGQALDDVKRAIAFTPAKEKEQLASEYSLLCDICIQLEDYPAALDAVDKALALNPGFAPLLNSRGNVCLHLGDAEGATAAFKALQRQQTRSPEAFFGLARAAIMANNFGQALDYMKQARELAPSDAITYCRLGDLQRDLGDIAAAATSYIMAFSLSQQGDRPVAALIDLASENYDAVTDVLDRTMGQTSNQAPFNLLAGKIALATGHFTDAYKEFRTLGESNPQLAPNLAPSLARISLALGNVQEASTYADRAYVATASAENALLKSYIEEARGNLPAAGIYAQTALRQESPLKQEARLQAASLAAASGDEAKAAQILSDGLLEDPASRELLLMRSEVQPSSEQAEADRRRAAAGDAEGWRQLALKAIALQRLGTLIDSQTIARSLEDAANAGDLEAAIQLAIYYKACGDKIKFSAWREKAMDLGLEDKYRTDYSVRPIYSLK